MNFFIPALVCKNKNTEKIDSDSQMFKLDNEGEMGNLSKYHSLTKLVTPTMPQ